MIGATALRATVYACAFVALWIWFAYEAHLREVSFGFPLPEWAAPIGVALMALGLVIMAVCVATFVVRGRGTPAPFDPPRAFVASGPYRWVRNPMYIGMFTFLVGYALCAVSFPALLVAFAMLAAAHLVAVLYEEPSLARRFGEPYREYRRTTPRWIPRPPRRPARPAIGS
ncbi:MAG TPA: isoprenylcysteine carboxylmethyltransferase family protein [Gemmatimonadota bacterium]|nr:isoprenylcysteine carboxylmethyltransferase family protein [Gemmatimonadota bacterium]